MPRTLNDIIPPSRRRTVDSVPVLDTYNAPPPPPSRPTNTRAPRPARRFPYGTALIAVIVVAASAAGLYAFSGAKVEVTPMTNAAYVTGDFSATPTTGDLAYEIVETDKVATVSVPAESSESANDPAQGQITIYNAQPTPQQLIKNTRFSTPDGLIFRIHDSITVPAGTATTPGTLVVTAYADAGGDKYNVGATTFKLPGLAGTKASDLVYAKSVGAMTGGFSGTRPSVSQTTKDAKATELQTELTKSLDTDIKAKIPQGYVLVPGASFMTFEQQPSGSSASGSVDVKEKGTLTAVLLPSDSLAKAIAYRVIGTYSGQPVSLASVDSLKLAPAGGVAPVAGSPFTFTLTGDVTIVWNVDQSKIAGAVAGKTRDSAQVVLSGFPEVDKAVLVLRPFWASTFPQDPTHITVTVNPIAGAVAPKAAK